MKFTLVFPSGEGWDLAIGLIFAPCAIWHFGGKIFSNPHPDNPQYLAGDFQNLLDELEKRKISNFSRSDLKGKNLFVIVHHIGHGTKDFLDRLVDDISQTGMIPIIVNKNQSE